MPLNPDPSTDSGLRDIRARAEGIGYRVTITGAGNSIFIDMGPEKHGEGAFPTLSWNKDENEEKGWQAALDLIEAEERRQACAEAMKDIGMPREQFDQLVRNGKIEEGKAYYVKQGDGVAVVTAILTTPKEDFEAASTDGIERVEDVPRT